MPSSVVCISSLTLAHVLFHHRELTRSIIQHTPACCCKYSIRCWIYQSVCRMSVQLNPAWGGSFDFDVRTEQENALGRGSIAAGPAVHHCLQIIDWLGCWEMLQLCQLHMLLLPPTPADWFQLLVSFTTKDVSAQPSLNNGGALLKELHPSGKVGDPRRASTAYWEMWEVEINTITHTHRAWEGSLYSHP